MIHAVIGRDQVMGSRVHATKYDPESVTSRGQADSGKVSEKRTML